ncbi:hypothetical protein [uncultured Psychrosphaera sp.]|uniref:hypothetical protein n=1 Tax=uncultured Psychrosphaera sp. TaxID=1403522 RepID=UPI0030F68878
MEPNFERYTLKELQECFESLDKAKWPERAIKIEQLIKQAKCNPIHVSEETTPINQNLVMMFVIGLTIIVSLILGKVTISNRYDGFSYADNPFVFSLCIGVLLFIFLQYLSRYLISKKDD